MPEDVAIIGFDDLCLARSSIPALITVRRPLKEMAETAYKMTVIDKNKVFRKPQDIILRPEIVIRKSA